jgi:mycothiol system anti-sigma-R factor
MDTVHLAARNGQTLTERERETRPAESVPPRCAVFLERLWLLIDGECPARMCESLLRHLDECPDCMSRFRLEARIKRLIATKCGGDKRPKR